MNQPDLSLIMLSWNTRELTQAALDALDRCRSASDLSYEVIVIDNASADDSVAMLQEHFSWVRLYRNEENLGYARGVNQGLELAQGRFLCLLGSDTEVRPGTFETMIAFLEENDEVGGVAPRFINPDGSPQRACMRFPNLTTALWYDTWLEERWPKGKVLERYNYRDWSHDDDREVDQPPGTCFMVRREVYDELGPMDRKLWLFFNDVDWCLRIRKAGWKIWYLHEGTEVLHHLGASTGRFPTFPIEWHKNRLHFYRKHYHIMGVVIVKAAMVYVALRQVRRIRKNLDSTKEFMAHSKQILGHLGRVLLS